MTGPPQRFSSGVDRLWFSSAGRSTRRAVKQAADLILPTWCVGCGAAGADLCAECSIDIRLLTRCPFRAEGAAEALPVTDVDDAGVQVLPVTSAGFYKTLVADVVVAFKDHERVGLKRVLAPALARSVRAAAERTLSTADPLLVWPPTSARAQLRRGRSPVEELVTAAALPAGLERAGAVLRRKSGGMLSVTGRRGQKGRSKGGRRAAVAQFTMAAGVPRSLAGREALLVDDVLTTGATLHGMYAALTEAGVHVRGAAVLAVTPRAGKAQDTSLSAANLR